MEFRYFKSVEGRAVKRFGTDAFIGCTRTPDGFVWDTDKVVPIPADEVARNLRSYRNALQDRGHGPDLIEVDGPAPEKKTPARRAVVVDDGDLAGPKDQDSTEPKARKRAKGKAKK